MVYNIRAHLTEELACLKVYNIVRMNNDLFCIICLCEINNISELFYFSTSTVFLIPLVTCSTAQQKAVWH